MEISSTGRRREIQDNGINPSPLLREKILDLERTNIGIFPFCRSLELPPHPGFIFKYLGYK